jgi:predicted DsbA family dithiol-disulfide isomerase
MTTVEVFADVGCPFAHLGLRRWVARRAEVGRTDVPLLVRAWPLELVNGEPTSAGQVGSEVDQLREQVDVAGAFDGFDAARFPSSTVPAMLLTALAYRSDAPTGEAVALELRRRLFDRGEDVGQLDLLREVAAGHGVDLPSGWERGRAVEEEWHRGEQRGVEGSPHFFADGYGEFCPHLRIEQAGDDHLAITDTPGRFEALCRASFG